MIKLFNHTDTAEYYKLTLSKTENTGPVSIVMICINKFYSQLAFGQLPFLYNFTSAFSSHSKSLTYYSKTVSLTNFGKLSTNFERHKHVKQTIFIKLI